MAAPLSRADQKLRRRQAKRPASPRQVSYLAWLGHTEPVASMAEASELIDRLKAARRARRRREPVRSAP